VIKRQDVIVLDDARRTSALPARNRPVRGVRLVELEPGRYAIEHTCSCGEVSVIEVETPPAAPVEENQA